MTNRIDSNMQQQRHLASSEFRSYPYLTPEEFTEVCHHLERRYCQARLGVQRRRWMLDTFRAFNTADFTFGPEYGTYLVIRRPLDAVRDDEGLSSCMGAFSLGEETGGEDEDGEMMEAEEADQVNHVQLDDRDYLPHGVRPRPRVRYEIILHPTYQVPCLWFNLQDLPADEDPLNIDTVFRWLVPDEYKAPLRASVGRIGGISLDVRRPTLPLRFPSYICDLPCLDELDTGC
ncbi:uncharacterized protein P884DRAFT_78067 [Thermothelomyces heterothallicus CBS 202.75]|uniref:uncharacterized protein n=1 Tax=Thermothelomyces heterothallicus CBS 202.75 TaxID=1149848 RepID=UPI003742ED37